MAPAKSAPEQAGELAGSPILTHPAAVFWGFVGLHVAAWTLVPALVDPNLPLDVIEGLAWGREWHLGYAKHPPLSPWLMEIFGAAGRVLHGHAVGWPLYLLSQVCVGVALWAMWRLARDMLDAVPALLSVLLLEGIYYHNFTSPEFNANVVLLPCWAVAILALHRALRDGAWIAWVVWGVAAGLGMLGKYYTAVLLVAMAALMLTTPTYRRQLAGAGPYIGVAVFAAVLLPHVVWLVSNDFPSFTYAAARAQNNVGTWAGHIVYPLRFLLGQSPIVLPAVLILLTLGRPERSGRLSREATRFLMFVGFGPILVTVLLSAAVGFKVRSMWGTPLFLTSGLMLIGWFGPCLSAAGLRRFAWAWTGIFILAISAYAGTALLRPLFYEIGKRTHFPGRPLAAVLTAAWHDRYDSAVPVIIGDGWLAGNAAYYSPDRPSVYIDGDPAIAPWQSDTAVRASGGLLVWYEDREGSAANWQQRFSPVEEQAPITLPWQTWGNLPPVTVRWAIVPPSGGAIAR